MKLSPRSMPRTLGVAAALLAAAALHAPAQAAGKAEVQWVEPQNFRDAGFGAWERDRTLKSLGEFIEKLGQQLPDGQLLKLTVTDLDLAGDVFPRAAREVRIVRGSADWPQMTASYSLTTSDGRVLKSGNADIADLGYFFTPRNASAIDGDFPYEKRMIHRWFNEQIVDDKHTRP